MVYKNLIKIGVYFAIATAIWFAYQSIKSFHFEAGANQERARYEKMLAGQAAEHSRMLKNALSQSSGEMELIEKERKRAALKAIELEKLLSVELSKQPEVIEIVKTEFKCRNLGNDFVRLYNKAALARTGNNNKDDR